MTAPRTAAGRELLATLATDWGKGTALVTAPAVLRIEAEAAVEPTALLRALVEAWDNPDQKPHYSTTIAVRFTAARAYLREKGLA